MLSSQQLSKLTTIRHLERSEGALYKNRFFGVCPLNDRLAFTLAEVLITLGIIGIVAAITMPALLSNNKNKEFQTGLKKSYSVLQQALARASLDSGEIITSKNVEGHTLKNTLMKHMNSVQDCGTGTENSACIQNTDYDTTHTKKNYKTYNRKANAFQAYFDDGQAVVSDGMLIMFENISIGRVYISVDVNGFRKAPNIWGKDLFTFQLMSDGKLLPMGAEGTDYKEETYCSITSSSIYNGIACANMALNDDNFWK